MAALSLAASITAAGDSGTGWVKHEGNPVLRPGTSPWDDIAIGQPSCLVEDGHIRMWYATRGTDGLGRIALAESTDSGVTWSRHDGGRPALDVGPPGAWDAFAVDTPAVIRVGAEYLLYYYGAASSSSDGASIGLATSADGVSWQRHQDSPVLEPGPPGAWDERWVESPTVLVEADSGDLLMWYSGLDITWQGRTGLATSPDGVHWTKHPGNPVLDLGMEGSWEDWMVGVATVLRVGRTYRLWYSGVSSADLADGAIDTPSIGAVTSRDGVHWQPRGDEPVLSTLDPPHDPTVDWNGPWAPSVVLDHRANRFLMLYETRAGICLATAPGPSRVRRPAGRLSP
jgi:predicted GH43/DUF377 family glycosyl hydrolase